jgi:hypothetical protein
VGLSIRAPVSDCGIASPTPLFASQSPFRYLHIIAVI